ncbi:universal stress protein [Hutsoniella sourekii]|uniref:universal stress protein n=1 Tax=Hutsoniella sourekii TaxID=87650 RepID=UPI000480394D|nr:universal stress protein [Hutsoniella sourekii]
MTAPYKKLLVAIDGSPTSDLAFKRAVELAKEFEAHLEIVHAVEDLTTASPHDEFRAVLDIYRKKGQSLLADYQGQAEKLACPSFDLELLIGDPRFQIVKYAKEQDCDLILVGSTGKGALQKMLIGSVSDYITKHAACDVLIVRQ